MRDARDDEVAARLLDMLRSMTPQEILATTVRAGVHNPDGTLTAQYAPEVLSVDEVAAYLRVNRKAIYDAIVAGSLPAARVGKSHAWRIRKVDVDELFRRQPKE